MKTPDELEREVMYWKSIAAYLASCHAATLEGFPKSGSKSERRRLVAICKNSAAYLRGTIQPPYFSPTPERIAVEVERCEQAAKNHQ